MKLNKKFQKVINWIAAPYVIPVSLIQCCMSNRPVEETWYEIGRYLRGEF